MRKALFLALVIFSGCRVREADVTIVSTDVPDFERIKVARDYQNPPKIETKVYRHWFLIFPFPLSRPTVEDAVDELLKKGNGDVAVDAVLHSFGWWFFLYGRDGWEIEGRVLNTHNRYPGEG